MPVRYELARLGERRFGHLSESSPPRSRGSGGFSSEPRIPSTEHLIQIVIEVEYMQVAHLFPPFTWATTYCCGAPAADSTECRPPSFYAKLTGLGIPVALGSEYRNQARLQGCRQYEVPSLLKL
jgi:hypothetical protein